ncbi:enoyl-[acyl-carrier-protein] reductase FabV [Endozoicomonas sp. OPT23]|uniref:enoyl-ACP reductase FabV n=1 Tax=Endozoicomonas sp. OPT23 TaxID=2072845 RepID=UPI00129A5DE3|nr:enoyl-ACP reductase FabV [Endozoicomonas sp. OPT23]MRI32244.1 enoyl-[acyl-carrier-protein] reductase FabV [Endozoicomonas sp. OPT23]
MAIEPIIKGVIARNCDPEGCSKAVLKQINFVKEQPTPAYTPKRVLIIGASSGFGLATRIAAAFGAGADTIGVSFERSPSETGCGTAGWYNNLAFCETAGKDELIAHNIVGDAFSPAIRQHVVNTIKERFEGKVDLVVYSLATGIRPDHQTGELVRSAIKPTGQKYQGMTLDLEHETLHPVTLEPASQKEINDTVKVMGGEDWHEWINLLADKKLLAKDVKTLAYSYIGPEITHELYHQGTLGFAKQDLQRHAAKINDLLKPFSGEARVAVCKALVTKASVFIPGFGPYIMALYKVMKELNLHEGCIEQMQRMFSEKLKPFGNSVVDSENLIRMDDWELKPEVQNNVRQLLEQMTEDNFKSLLDFDGLKSEFLELNGFFRETLSSSR